MVLLISSIQRFAFFCKKTIFLGDGQLGFLKTKSVSPERATKKAHRQPNLPFQGARWHYGYLLTGALPTV
jgi:hypothetical protein